MKQAYIEKTFRPASLDLIEIIDGIIADYQAQGYMLTTRQLYYQLVARDMIPNTLQEYKRVAGLINDAKLAGLLDWDAIEDRTRDFVRQTRWSSPEQILQAACDSYHVDHWVGQQQRVFCIVEKEALVGVLERVCRRYDVPLLAARGYPSGTVLREFVQSDVLPALDEVQRPIVLHLGDHDPSGIDMTRDLEERLALFTGQWVSVRRIALTMDQVEEERPPENPAKTTDSRFEGYLKQYGTSSWELDALSPQYLDNLVADHIKSHIDSVKWAEISARLDMTKTRIRELGAKL